MPHSDHPIIRRGFLRIGERQVHYRIVGEGPPALFIHSSPTNGSFVVPDMLARAADYTCYAFDTPGFGLSDPLPLKEMLVADLADAIAEAMDAMGLPPLPVYGTHSGAAIGLELGYRHPAKVTGLVLDGVPVFTRDEVVPLSGPYFAPLVADVLGGHFAATWTRFRDQSLWFPWCFREPANLNDYDLATPASTHNWTAMFFAAAPHYKPAYLAVTSYCEGAITAAAGLTVPAIFTATTTDMLYPHLVRLPPLRDHQRIVEIGTSHERKRALTGEGFAEFGSPGLAPSPALTLDDGDTIRRQFVMDGARAQMIRYAGDRAAPPLLILHDTPGSGKRLEARMAAHADTHFVIVPDLPGSGDSEPLGEGEAIGAYAAATWRLCDALGLERIEILACGFGASLGVEMAAVAPERCVGLAIDGLLLPDADPRADLRARYAPPVEIGADGSHWYRLWLMLRDSQVYWPWYDSRRGALRRVPLPFEAWDLHDWTVEVMKQSESYHRYLHAAIDQDAAARLAAVRAPVTLIDDPLSALGAAYGDRLRALLADSPADARCFGVAA